MKSDHYAIRTKKRTRKKDGDSFRTDQISIRGFVRELKSKLLKGKEFSLEDPEYKSVVNAFDKLWTEKDLSEPSFVGDSCFSKWWNGIQYPDISQRQYIDKLFPGLSDKWFNRVNFKDRMQLHLASLDLFRMSRNCNCQDGKERETELDTHCDTCLVRALGEAEWILRAIHNDWQPIDADVCISGPAVSSGLNFTENIFESVLFDEQYGLISYDLSLEDCSFIGLQLPEEIMKIYQDENPFSIVLFLFLLVGLDLKAESEYRDDLVLDFMTALNCSGLILAVKYNSFISTKSDFIGEKIQRALFNIIDYFYGHPVDLNEKLTRYEKACKQSTATGKPSFGDIIQPVTHLSCHSGVKLSELFLDILNFVIKDQDVDLFMAGIAEVSHSSKHERSKVDKYWYSLILLNLPNLPSLQVFKSLELFRERYLDLFDITGYSREELIDELSKTVCLPANMVISPGLTPFKSSPYANKMTFGKRG